ncbi:Stress-induced-phosphoprotein 1 [Hypsibius exemplaris]|uniref:Stress-induced-phosphoprotein 1 n=1 Tax=Hypsibius exemplaris TaxID=2072580 RepID=A0A9X6NIN3_HYPEX|nr:Stress-induced-phosphoprotein 1 [Hypsibius exemplaris]
METPGSAVSITGPRTTKDIVALEVALVNLALKCYPDRTDLVDQVLQNVDVIFQKQHVDEVPGDSAVCKELAKLLKIPLDHYQDILTVLQLPNYGKILAYLNFKPRKEISLYVAHNIVDHCTIISQQEQVEALLFCHQTISMLAKLELFEMSVRLFLQGALAVSRTPFENNEQVAYEYRTQSFYREAISNSIVEMICVLVVQLLTDEGDLAMQRGNLMKALKKYEKATKKSEKAGEAHWVLYAKLAYCRLRSGLLPASLSASESAIAADSQSATPDCEAYKAYLYKIDALKLMERLPEAVAVCETALERFVFKTELFRSEKTLLLIRDAESCQSMQERPRDMAEKGYSRKGAALAYLKRHEDAVQAYEEGLKHDPGNQQLKDGLAEVRAAAANTGGGRGGGAFPSGPVGGAGGGFPNPFAGPGLMEKLQNDPRTREFADQPDFQNIIRNLQANPSSLMAHLSDPRVSKALSVLLGLDLSTMGGGTGGMDDDDGEMEDADAPFSSFTSPKPHQSTVFSSSTAAPEKGDSKECLKDMTEEQKKAWYEKEVGNEAYKKKDFETALKHYDAAIELDPTNVKYQTKKAALVFDQGNYQVCIDLCHKIVDIGQASGADRQLINSTFVRLGSAHLKLGQTFLEKALSGFDGDQYEVEVTHDINHELAEEENKGNEFFKKGDYPTALKHYSETIKRNPSNGKLYSNRAAAYTKLLEFSLGIKDCDECLKLDPSFVKAHIRKASILLAMKQPSKAAHSFEKALQLDPDNQEAREGLAKVTLENQTNPEEARRRAMEDPEIQDILGDPEIQMILEQMQEDPRAIQDHLKNPEVANRIKKLIAAGLVWM